MGDERKWLVLGAGGHAASVAAILQRLGDLVVAHSMVNPASAGADESAIRNDRRFGSDDEALQWARDHQVVAAAAVGDSAVRRRLVAAARAAGVALPAVVAASAVIADGCEIGPAAVVGEAAVLGPGCVVGDGAIVNTGAVVEHHAHVGAFAHIAPRAVLLGAVRVGDDCLVGASSVVLPGCAIGKGATVGAGSVVTDVVDPDATVVGAPARTPSRTERKAGL